MIMDNLLKLKLDLVYRGLSIEQARQRFELLKTTTPKERDVPVVTKRRKLRIPVTEDK
jgi:hypothetical protein